MEKVRETLQYTLVVGVICAVATSWVSWTRIWLVVNAAALLVLIIVQAVRWIRSGKK